jgi:trimethyllysine dioxygenase
VQEAVADGYAITISWTTHHSPLVWSLQFLLRAMRCPLGAATARFRPTSSSRTQPFPLNHQPPSPFQFLSRGFQPPPRSRCLYQASAAVPAQELFGKSPTFASRAPKGFIRGSALSSDGENVTLKYADGIFTFHSRWLHDAAVDKAVSKRSDRVFLSKLACPRIQSIRTTTNSTTADLEICWTNQEVSLLPVAWLRVYAPLVAKQHGQAVGTAGNEQCAWLAHNVKIPEFSYLDIFPQHATPEKLNAMKEKIYPVLLQDSEVGIIKVVDLPPANLKSERAKKNTLVTKVLKQLFESVFYHPVRGTDLTFNIASHHPEDSKRGRSLPNYDTDQVLLPHTDHSHYEHPARVQGLYALEGESENTFVSFIAALRTMTAEAPHLVEHLQRAPVAFGRVAHFYSPTMYNATCDTAITMQPGFPHQIKRFRWHPHLGGFLLTPYEKFKEANLAYRMFQEILRRPTHQLRVEFKPGDMYIWDNFRVLHGRERVLTTPRTSVGQTVPEQVVIDKHRELRIHKLKDVIHEKWLIHLPPSQLDHMDRLFNHVGETKIGTGFNTGIISERV